MNLQILKIFCQAKHFCLYKLSSELIGKARISSLNLRQIFYLQCIYKNMGGQQSGALNSSGFSHSVAQNRLPYYEHITHSGIFNQNFFSVGKKAENLLELHCGVGVSNCDLYDLPKRNYFLSLFLKSNTDGQKRSRPINILICLDVSGSMSCPLNRHIDAINPKSRLDLARQAIQMLFKKLKDDDVFTFVIFHTKARTIIKSTFKKNLNADLVHQQIFANFQSGGTTIKQGFNCAIQNIQNFKLQTALTQNYQNRVVILTDVEDNSIQNEYALIDKISSQQNINTTIIGVSTDFKSSTCQKMIKIKGFNYLCAVQNSDLQTYLSDRFDYNFFPCVQNVKITMEMETDIVQDIEVYGTVDSTTKYEKQNEKFTITQFSTGFPSDLTINKQGQVQTQGGQILVKLNLKKNQFQLPNFKVKLVLSYESLQNQQTIQQYKIDNKVQVQQYFSDGAVEKGIKLFYYTQTLRNLLKNMGQKDGENRLSDINKQLYKEKLMRLTEICPLSKKEELVKIIQIVEDQKNPIQAR